MQTKTGDFNKKTYIILFIIIALAAVVRINLLGLHRLHMDECLYSNYAMRMVDRGDLLLNGGLQVDKPPLFFYAIALSFFVNGKSENAARIPNIIFSLLTIFFVFKLANHMYKDATTSILSAFFVSFSVMFVLFSTTAFQDVSMMMFFIMALIVAYENKFKLSGLFYACSIACKPMTLFLLPVYVYYIFGFCELKPYKKNILDVVIGMFFVFIPLVLWSALAANPRFGIFKFFITQQPEVMKVSFNIWQRLNSWILHSKHVLNNFYYLAAAVAGIITCVAFSLIRKTNETRSDLFLCVSFFYLVLILTAINFRIFDRYVLVFIPFAAIMLARTISRAVSFIKRAPARIFIVVVFASPFFIYMNGLPDKGPAMGALQTGTDGFEKVAEYLKDNQKDEVQLVYFGHTLSWYGYFYLYNTKFGELKLTYDLNELEKAIKSFKGQSLIVLNARHRSKDELNWIKNQYELVLDVRDKEKTGEKFLIFRGNN